MDFIARQGNIMNRAYRWVGLFAILIVAQFTYIYQLHMSLSTIAADYQRVAASFNALKDDMRVYVVPGSSAGIYAPERSEMLLQHFANHVTQSLLTFTPVNVKTQYNEVKNFYDTNMLTYIAPQLQKRTEDSGIIGSGSLFIPDWNSYTVEDVEHSTAAGGIAQKKVTLEGMVHTVLAGGSIEEKPLKITMVLNKTTVSKTNPFGYIVHKYTETTMTKGR